MNSEDFTHYYGRHKHQGNVVVQESVVRRYKKYQFWADSGLTKKIDAKCKELDKDFSELNRILWQAYFIVEENNAWKKEVESWNKKIN